MATLSPAVVLAAFAATLFLSAFLLFSAEPMFAKMALPALGGTPAVWAVSMCFFQAALLAGTVYAHTLNRYLEPRRAVLLHVAVLGFAVLALPISLPALASNPPSDGAYLWLLGVLALGVGLPFFAVSANAPLLQAWFSRTGHKDAQDPYFLYGASNLGSLMALVAYPIAVEPRLGLLAQSGLWSSGYFALAALIAVCGSVVVGDLRSSSEGSQSEAPRVPQSSAIAGAGASAKLRSSWIALAAVPSGLLVAVTTYITTDVASAPFIWVVPLALFLATFILVFKERLAFNYSWTLTALPLAIVAHVAMPVYAIGVASGIVAFVLAAIVCHRELYLRRPEPSRLTEFYICMSIGGVIGGVFSALVAPQIFASVIEFKLLLVLSLLARPGVLAGLDGRRQVLRLALFAAGMTAAFLTYKWLVREDVLSGDGAGLACLIGLALIAVARTRHWPEHRAVLILTMLVALAVVPTDGRTIYLERSFFGTIRVMQSEDGQHRLMLHGTTLHGAERVRTADGRPVQNAPPATYYYAEGPMARGVALARRLAVARGRPLTTGIVGLGTGSLACYAAPGDSWRFFEIDPMVVRVARRPDLFTFLTRCLPDNDVVIGDARLTLQKESDGKFGYLVIDAFSSDAIPVHLLTREAIEMYASKLAPGGLIAIHISNQFLDLAPSIAATVGAIPGLRGVHVEPLPTASVPDATQSHVVFLTRDEATFDALKADWPKARALDANGAEPWTDDYSNVLSTLIRGLTR
jgi:spermidine synthase